MAKYVSLIDLIKDKLPPYLIFDFGTYDFQIKYGKYGGIMAGYFISSNEHGNPPDTIVMTEECENTNDLKNAIENLAEQLTIIISEIKTQLQ
jgi:hypothetical protein